MLNKIYVLNNYNVKQTHREMKKWDYKTSREQKIHIYQPTHLYTNREWEMSGSIWLYTLLEQFSVRSLHTQKTPAIYWPQTDEN